MNELEKPSDSAARLAESVRRALQLVGPVDSRSERVRDEPSARPAA